MIRKIYRRERSLKEARQQWQTTFAGRFTPAEEMNVSEACGRVTAEPVFARRSAPHFAASAMDGIAVDVRDTLLAGDECPVALADGSHAFRIDTGEPIPAQCNAVIRIEEVNRAADGRWLIKKPASLWQNIRSVGENVMDGEMLLTANHPLRSYDIGGLLEAGVTRVTVRRRPRVGIIPTGTELVPAAATPGYGQLVEFNSHVLSASVREWGGVAHTSAILPDQSERIREQLIEELAEHDIVVILSGSSAGREDLTVDILAEMGEVFVHGVRMAPGKPVILARVKGKPVVGLPGYPLAAVLNAYLFVRPLMYRLTGLPVPELPSVSATVRRKFPPKAGVTQFQRVNLARIQGEMVAVPRRKGASSLESLRKADGIMPISASGDGLQPGDQATVYLLKPQKEIERNLLLLGGHDRTLELLQNQLRQAQVGFDLVTQAVGSIAGVTALRDGECHMAGVHLPDTATGEYNFPCVEEILRGQEVLLLHLVDRMLGLMVRPGNPKAIGRMADLTRPDVACINRQRGSETRAFLDVWMTRNHCAREAVTGYDREMHTDIGAAAAVAAGSADAALGHLATAQAMGLEFIPIGEETYDLVLPVRLLEDERMQTILAVLSSPSFQSRVESLGGYRAAQSGQIRRREEEMNCDRSARSAGAKD